MAPKRMQDERDAAAFDFAAQWDIPETEELTLPGGKRVIVRTPDLAQLAKAGLVPNHLLPIVEKFALEGPLKTIIDVNPEIIAESPGAGLIRAAELNEYIDYFCVAAVVTPALSLDGADDTVKVTKLTRDERFAIWDWGVGLTAALARFSEQRARQAESVPPPSDGGEVRDATEPVARADAA